MTNILILCECIVRRTISMISCKFFLANKKLFVKILYKHLKILTSLKNMLRVLRFCLEFRLFIRIIKNFLQLEFLKLELLKNIRLPKISEIQILTRREFFFLNLPWKYDNYTI